MIAAHAIRPCLGLAGLAARVPAWLARKQGSAAARRIERTAFAALARSFGLTVETAGNPPPHGTLIVSNHISWADIPVLRALIDADFVARSDLADWPGIGQLARRMGTLFVERARRGTAALQAEAVVRRLGAGRSVLLFPEGTTSDGSRVLPFRSSLFEAAQGAARIQPAMIAYLAPDGAPLDAQRLREIAWTGDDGLLSGAIRLARLPARVRIEWLEPLRVADFSGRKALAEAARDAIASAYTAANRSR